jgi:hypothetical protein
LETGKTSVALDLGLLANVGLVFEGVSDDVIVPGHIEDSVAFRINSRTATDPLRPTTFIYDSDNFLPFSGTIEHQGSVFFEGDPDPLEVGNFSIGFDDSRVVSSTTSGFFVESTVGLAAILFDIAPPTELTTSDSALTIGGDLLVSPELAGVLGNEELIYVDVGDALVEGRVPVPTTLALLAVGLAAAGGIGRRPSRT